MNYWFVITFLDDDEFPVEVTVQEMHGPYKNEGELEEAVDRVIDENLDDGDAPNCIIARFTLASDDVPELLKSDD